MKSTFLDTSPLNFNIFIVALETEKAIWERRTEAGIVCNRDNFRIHEGDIISIIQTFEREGLIIVPKEQLQVLLNSYLKHNKAE